MASSPASFPMAMSWPQATSTEEIGLSRPITNLGPHSVTAAASPAAPIPAVASAALSSAIPSPATPPPSSALAALRKEFESLIKDAPSIDFVQQGRRLCNFSVIDSQTSITRAQSAVFIENHQLLSAEPIRFLPSPFVFADSDYAFINRITNESMLQELTEQEKKARHALGITANGKHVILQQAIKSCVPTCIAMLALDHGKKPNYELIQTVSLATPEEQERWLKEVGFKVHPMKIGQDNLKNWPEILFKCLAERGPGILGVCHPDIGNHAVVLDAISPDFRTAMIRDPFHGRMVTIPIMLLQIWCEKLIAREATLECIMDFTQVS